MGKSLIKALQTIAMARGTVVIDENLRNLANPLQDKNIRTRLPPLGMSDDKIAHDYLPNRVFITNNSKDFIKYAPQFDIGIIATESLKSLDAENLADMISDVITEYSIWSLRHGFILHLKDDGRHEMVPLTE